MDTPFASSTSSGDSRLLLELLRQERRRATYTDEQKRAIAGFRDGRDDQQSVARPGAALQCDRAMPEGLTPEQRYHPVNNPKGARCTIWDHGAVVYGRDPKTGFARRPLDNVGIQYGLEALNAAAITKEQFLDLNEKIGGFDIDGNVVAPADDGRRRGCARRVSLRAGWRAAAAASPRRRSSTTARTTTISRAATCTSVSTPSRRARGWKRPTATRTT